MSINSALLAGMSGLLTNSSAMAAISDNIANVNTVGYKRNQINFSNLVTEGSVKGRFSAGGVKGQTTQYVSQQGLLQNSNSSTDIAIGGDGFFVATEKPTGLTQADTRVFTRAGSFHVDDQGYLQNTAGFYLQGWLADAAGDILADPSDLNKLSSINIKNIGATVIATPNVQVTANLNSNTATSTAAQNPYHAVTNPTGYHAQANSMSAYDAVTGTGVRPDFTIQLGIVDSKGGTHTVSMSVLKAPTPANTWYAEIYGNPAEIASGAPTLAPGQIRTGTVAFNQDGTIDLANSTIFGATVAERMNPRITLGPSRTAAGPSAPADGTAEWQKSLGVEGQDVGVNLASAAGGLTQLASVSTVKAVTNFGAGVGQVTGVEINEKGIVSAVFDNGEVRTIAQVAVATFTNPDGLIAVSGNAWRPSLASGDFALKKPTEGGAGTISNSSLEASTVDLSTEFTGLITTQRAYSACSRIISTADQMMEELLNIKR